MGFRPVRLPFGLIVLATLACDASQPDLATVRDSAGVAIVEHAPGAVEAVERWTTGEEATLRIGVAEGDPAYQFFRVADVLAMEDGRVVVVDQGARALRMYGPDGSFLTTHGRDGEGPGEYRQPVALWPLPGDSLAVFDRQSRQVTVLSDRLGFGRVERVTMLGPNPVLQDGTLAGGLLLGTSGQPEEGEEGIVPLHLWRLGVTQPLADPVLTVPGLERVGRYWPIYGWTTRAAASGSRLLVGTGREAEVAEYEVGPDGSAALRRLIRWPAEAEPVGDGDFEAYFRAYVERTRTTPENEAGLRQSLEDVPVAATKPVYNELKLDAAGNLWVRDYVFPWQVVPPETEWTVFAPDGRVRARATLPARFLPFEIREEDVLGLEHDGTDVQRVVVLPLIKSAPGA